MKLLTFAVPCYNSQEYMKTCIDSLLPGGDEVEILLIDDGSSDDTARIADEYAARFPQMIKAIHQTNGGHGEAVNTGIRHAKGLYFKVVDSDDWVDEAAYESVLDCLRAFRAQKESVDMLLTDFVYEKEGARHKSVMRQPGFPKNRPMSWSDIRHFYLTHYILMHAIVYRTKVLRESGLHLPAHTFYVDNLYAYHPLPYVQTLYYLPVPLYRYHIGRADQSVNEEVMMRRIDQQIAVNLLMIDDCDLWSLPQKMCRRYMIHYLEIVTAVSSFFLLKSGTKEDLAKKQMLWEYLKQKDPRLYGILRHRIMGWGVNLRSKAGRMLCLFVYQTARKIIGFN